MPKSCKEVFTDLGFIFKFTETLICLAMIIVDLVLECAYSADGYRCIVVCYGGYFIICFTFFIIYIIEDTHHMYEMIIIGGGGVFFLVTGIFVLVINVKDLATCQLIMIILLLANGVIMIVDLVREVKKG